MNFQLSNFKFQILIGIYISLMLSLLLPPPAEAAGQSLRISPVIINVGLSPDKTYTHEVTIENLTDTPMPLKASFNDFITTGEEGGYVFQDTKTNPLLSWSTLSETEFILSPKEKKKLQLTIQTPKQIPLGGYYGVLFFEPVIQHSQPTSTTINSKIGILMLANVGVPDPKAKKAEIETFSTGMFSSDGSFPMTLRVKNIALNFFTAKPILTIAPLIKSAGARDEKRIVLDDKFIFPGLVRRWEEDPVVEHLRPNLYTITMSVSTGDGQFVTATTHVLVFPLSQALSVTVLLIVIVFLIVKRKRLKTAFMALIK
jgi:hypothetical protein